MKAGRTIIVLLLVAVLLGAALVMSMPPNLDFSLDRVKPEETAAPDVPTLAGCAISHDHEFGAIFFESAIEDFNALGFAYGDSVDVTFSNGYQLRNLPYYNGYYTQTGEPLLVAYPGYPCIAAAINNGDCLWDVAKVSEGDTATITLNERGKYLDIQNARNIQYTDERADYATDEIFANFRSVHAGGIQPNRLYRAASPCDNQHNRAPYVDKLMGEAGVQWILNLSDDEEKIEGFLADPAFACEHFKALYDGGKVMPIALNMNYTSDVFREKIVSGLVNLSQQKGPYLVHCTEGKDRTGFVCMLLEALCGASYQEISEDYMLTYGNYYGVTQADDLTRYSVIVDSVLDPMIRGMLGDPNADPAAADLAAGAAAFLQAGGMTDEQITALRDCLMK